ncbi:MAG: hypothetical protein HYZ42_00665 [Bacteroidetes bacterium]|nr:hypothetical protein [Bacteroidota bacterium]
MKKIYINLLMLFCLLGVGNLHAQMIGTRTIPSTNFPTIKIAIDSINTFGVGGSGIVFNVTPGHYERTAGNIAVLTNTTSSNSITFQKNGAGANPIVTAGVGVGARDGIIRIEGTDNVTIDGLELRDTSLNTTTNQQMEYGIVSFKKSATDGCQKIVVRNCTITLNKANTGSIAIATVNNSNSGGTFTPTNAAYISYGHSYYSNILSNCYTAISMVGSTTINFADSANDIGTLGGNTISNFGGGSSQVNVIFIQNNNYITIRNNNISGGASSTNGVYGILVSTATAYPLQGNSAKVCSNTITLTSGATTSLLAGIAFSGTTGNASVVNIDSNSFTGCTFPTATSASYYMVYVSIHPYTLTINNNTFTNNKYGGSSTATGQMSGISIQGANSNSGSSTTVNGNTLTGFARYQSSLGAGPSYFIHSIASGFSNWYYSNFEKNI